MLFDSHAHVNFKAFDDNWQDVISDCQKNNIWMTNVGSQYETSLKAVSIAGQYETGVYASVGIHPVHANKVAFEKQRFDSMIRSSDKVVAIGECGIDFFHNQDHFDIQKEQFIQQIQLANEHNLALIIHGRNDKENKHSSYGEILNIVKAQKPNRAVVHCFGGTLEEAKQFLELGIYIGFTGIVTFKNAQELQEIAKNIPLENMLIETDCPYLTPEPFRGKENKPQHVEYVAQKIAQLKEMEYNKVAKNTFQNAEQFYATTKR